MEKENLHREQERMQRERMELEHKRHTDLESQVQPQSFQISQNMPTVFSVNTSMPATTSVRKVNKWTPSNEPLAAKSKQTLTREDMLAMNRKATPLQRKPDIEPSDNMHTESSINREVPTKHDLHNLNAVPKPKFRSNKDWISGNEPVSSNSHPRSDNSRNSPNIHEHWLVEEAERRRKANDQQTRTSPKPYSSHQNNRPHHDSGLSNRWRDDSSVPKQQFQSHSTITAPRPLTNNSSYNQPSHEPQSKYSPVSPQTRNLSQTLPAGMSLGSATPPKRELQVPTKHSRPSSSSSSLSSPSSPLSPSEQFMAVSGKQGCSHCSEELGGYRLCRNENTHFWFSIYTKN